MSALVLLLNLAVWGAHALLPCRLARGGEPARRLWARAALPAAGLSLVATAAALALDPDPAAAWGLHELLQGSRPALVVALGLGATLLADLVGALGWRRLEPAAWQAWGAVGALGLASATVGSELVRIGAGPAPAAAALLAAALLRAPLALAAAEALAGPPRWAAPLAGAALPLAVLLWPEPLRAVLGADRLTLGAAAALLLAARFLPERLRRPAAFAGVLLAALFLARAGDLSQALGAVEGAAALPPVPR
jgi:hypothetical protein